jgi:hypothetical protein
MTKANKFLYPKSSVSPSFFAFCAFAVKKLGFVEALIGLYAPAL